MLTQEGAEGAEPKRDKDLAEIFDLDRKRAVRTLVDNMEQSLRDIQTAQDDLKELVSSAREAAFSARDIAAMKTIARLRLKDEAGAAREKLEALERISEAVGFNLFDWADSRTA